MVTKLATANSLHILFSPLQTISSNEKVKEVRVHAMKSYRGVEVRLHSFLTPGSRLFCYPVLSVEIPFSSLKYFLLWPVRCRILQNVYIYQTERRHIIVGRIVRFYRHDSLKPYAAFPILNS
jgi:hypothetical protein